MRPSSKSQSSKNKTKQNKKEEKRFPSKGLTHVKA
jgi:hypothetical protein